MRFLLCLAIWFAGVTAWSQEVSQLALGPEPAAVSKQAAVSSPAPASESPPPSREGTRQMAASAEANRLPADSVTRHMVTLPGRTLRYTVSAGSLPLVDEQGRLLVEIAYVAYHLDGADAASRPISFAFNGGPGAASAYLHFGLMGPKRLAFGNQGDVPSQPPVLSDNAETWLDFTDMVFIDPVGTGYSRFVASGDEVRRQFWSVDGDARALSRIVAKYLARAGRLTSPKYLVGESYGGFRVPKIARLLGSQEGVGISGMVLIAPVLDFASQNMAASNVMSQVALLPSMAAARLEREGRFDREALIDAERYATGEYLADLMRGPDDKTAVERAAARVAQLTGLDPVFVRQLGGRVDARSFAREFHRAHGRVGSAYDVSVTGFDPYPASARTQYEDPVLDASMAPLTSAAVDYLSRTLNWKVDGRYHLLNGEVSRRWNWGNGIRPPEVVSDLRQLMALDSSVKVIIAHGATDLVTPYMATRLVLDQLPSFGTDRQVRFEVLEGGHMFYTRDRSRQALREEVRKIYAKPNVGQ